MTHVEFFPELWNRIALNALSVFSLFGIFFFFYRDRKISVYVFLERGHVAKFTRAYELRKYVLPL